MDVSRHVGVCKKKKQYFKCYVTIREKKKTGEKRKTKYNQRIEEQKLSCECEDEQHCLLVVAPMNIKSNMPGIPEDLQSYFEQDIASNGVKCKIRLKNGNRCPSHFKAYHKSVLRKHLQNLHPDQYRKFEKDEKEKREDITKGQQRLSSSRRSPTLAVEQSMAEPRAGTSREAEEEVDISSGAPFRKRSRREQDHKSQQRSMDQYVQHGTIAIKMTEQELYDACVDMCTINGRPFAAIDDSGFRKILNPILAAIPNAAMNQNKVKELIATKAANLTDAISARFKNKLLKVKLDGVSRNGRSFLGVNVQDVEEGKIQLYCLGVIELDNKHTGRYLAKTLEELLKKFSLKVSQIYTLTMDNGANMLKAGAVLEDEAYSEAELYNFLLEEEEDTSESETEYNKVLEKLRECVKVFSENYPESSIYVNVVNCTVHTLQLCVTDALTSVYSSDDNTSELTSRVRAAVRKLRTPTLSRLLSQKRIPKPTLDVAPRWSTTHNMYSSAYRCREFCEVLTTESPGLYPELELSNEEWKEVSLMIESLKPAKVATDKLQSEQLVIGDMFHIWTICSMSTNKINTPLAKRLFDNMKNRESKIFDNPVINAALYMDPRFQCTLSEERLEQARSHLAVLAARIEAFKQDDTLTILDEPEVIPPELEEEENTLSVEEREFNEAISNQQKQHSQRYANDTVSLLTKTEHEVKSLVFSSEYKTSLNVLKFWENRKHQNIKLYEIAMAVLGVPATQVSVERLFSGLKFIMSKLRANLTSDRIDQIMLIRTNHIYKKKVE